MDSNVLSRDFFIQTTLSNFKIFYMKKKNNIKNCDTVFFELSEMTFLF